MQNTQSNNRSNSSSGTKSQTMTVGAACLFAVITLVLRFAPLPENFGAFGALSVFCGLMLRGPLRWALPLMTLFAGDCLGQIMGTPGMGFYNAQSMLFNYLAMASMVLVGSCFSSMANRSDKAAWQSWVAVVVACLCGSVGFFLISNFGSWLDPLLPYDRSWNGLMTCYWNGLPFFRPTLQSDLVFGPAFYGVYQLAPMAIGIQGSRTR
jgi:hypothetical protein